MRTLDNNELLLINGGGILSFLKSASVGLVAAGVFIASVIYGYIHPNGCN